MLGLRVLREDDVVRVGQWPPYVGDTAQMDYALREGGWLEECRAKPGVFVYAVEDGGDLIGFTILERTGATEAEFRIALRPDRVGLGLGEEITRRTLRIGFVEHRFSRVHLIVRLNNERAFRLYRRIGFADCGSCHREIQGVQVAFRSMEMRRETFERQRPGEPPETGCASRARRALLVIDVQNDYVGGALPIEFPPVGHSLANIGKAMDAARGAGVPVVTVQNVLPEGAPFMARGTAGAELHPLVGARGADHHVLKGLPSAFAGTDLAEWLRGRGVDTVVIAGYMTHNCDLSTAVHALHAGFAVEFLSDATGAVPYANRAGVASAEEIHRVVTVVLHSRFAAVMTTAEWISLLSTGGEPERDSIHGSNRRARRLPGASGRTDASVPG